MTDPISSFTSPAPGRDAARWHVPAGAAAIVLAGLAAYANSFRGPFIFDDVPSIPENPAIRHLASSLQIFGAAGAASLSTAGRPVLGLSLAANYAISGASVWSYHAFNLAIHLLAALTLFGVLRRTLAGMARGTDCAGVRRAPAPRWLRTPADAFWPALATALIWAVHPLQTEAVTYVIQRAESLMGLFYLLTLYCFARGCEEQPWFGLSVLACLVSVGTKEVAATAPLMVLLYDRTFVAGSLREAWRRRRAFYLGLAATWIPLGALILAGGGNRGGTVGFGVGIAWWKYGLTQFEAVGRYLILAVWPHPLVFEYGAFWVTRADQVLPWAALVLPAIGATLWALRRRPAAGFAGAWFFAILAPTSLAPGTNQMIVEHRMYLPLAAVLALAVCGLFALAGRIGGKQPRLAAALRLGLPLAAVAALTLLTHLRNRDYSSDFSIWNATVTQRPDNVRARMHLGFALFQQGRIREATGQYERTLQLDPDYVAALDNLGVARSDQGRVGESLGLFGRALRIDPTNATAHNDYGNALRKLGRITEAIAQYRFALRFRPNYPEANYNLAVALVQTGHPAEAADCCAAALRLDPNLAAAHVFLGDLLRTQGRATEAIPHYEAALRLEPRSPYVHDILGVILAQSGRLSAAAAHFQAALALMPGLAEAHDHLGIVLGQEGRTAEAIREFQEALRLDPRSIEARSNLATARQAARP